MRDLEINRLPAPTWRWLKVNSENVKLPDAFAAAEQETELSGVKTDDAAEVKAAEISGLGEAFAAAAGSPEIPVSRFLADGPEGRLHIKNHFHETGSIAREEILAKEKTKLLVIMEADGSAEMAAHDIRFRVEKDAEVTLVEVLRLDGESAFLDGVFADVADNAVFRLIQVVIGGKKNWLGEDIRLAGKESKAENDIGYLLDEDKLLDVNAVVRHTGKQTESRVGISGVVDGRAKKTFRGTLDFIRGASGAKGEVRDNVLLMSDKVQNRTIPLILCGEEDVEGEHGATIGKISDETLFYFESRGIPEEEVNRLMARSMVDQVIGRIPDEKLRRSLLEEE